MSDDDGMLSPQLPLPLLLKAPDFFRVFLVEDLDFEGFGREALGDTVSGAVAWFVPPIARLKKALAIFSAPLLLNESSKLSWCTRELLGLPLAPALFTMSST